MPRNTRFIELFTVDDKSATVIGVGAVGRQVALMLASMGVPSLTLIDPDTVSEENLGTQGFLHAHLGAPKVIAVGEDCRARNPSLTLVTSQRRFTPAHVPRSPDAVFVCVDDMDDRKFIIDALTTRPPVPLAIFESRMSSETCAIHPLTTPAHIAHWHRTWFPTTEMSVEPCTRRATFHCASIAASLLISQWTNHLRGHPLPARIELAFTPTLLASVTDLPSL